MKGATRRLYRSETEKMIAGVCGGFGEYFNIDPVLVRLIFIITTLAGGSGILIYLILWILLPTESSVKKNSDEVIRENAEDLKEKANELTKEAEVFVESGNADKLSGFVLLGLGLIFLISMFGWPIWSFIWKLWPLILVVPGILILVKKD